MEGLVAGLTIAGRYELDRLLGEGGMGVVWAAHHVVTKKPVALKFLRASMASKPEVRRRFLREARAACSVRHANVVQIHDVVELEGGVPVMVMDLLEGESLGERLFREKQLSVADTAAILLPVVSAVCAAHDAGIIHRDLKPDNIFLVKQPAGGVVVRVLDFGIAKLTATEGDAAQTAGLTSTGSMLGTPYYMSPEQACGERDIDARSDTWSLGVILYECLAGRRPTEGPTLGQILKIIMTNAIKPLGEAAPGLPTAITACVGRMLSPARDQRPASLREVERVLASFAGGGTAILPLASSGARAQVDPLDRTHAAPAEADTNHPTSRGRRGARAIVPAVVGVAMVATGVLAWRWHAASVPIEPPSAIAQEHPTPAAAMSAPPAAARIAPSAGPSIAPAIVPSIASSAAPSIAPARASAIPSTPRARPRDATPSAVASPQASAPPAATSAARPPAGLIDKPPF